MDGTKVNYFLRRWIRRRIQRGLRRRYSIYYEGWGHHHHHSHQFNRWGNMGMNCSSMPGYVNVDYSGGWNPNYHDQLLRNNIDAVYMRYDFNYSGQLEGN